MESHRLLSCQITVINIVCLRVINCYWRACVIYARLGVSMCNLLVKRMQMDLRGLRGPMCRQQDGSGAQIDWREQFNSIWTLEILFNIIQTFHKHGEQIWMSSIYKSKQHRKFIIFQLGPGFYLVSKGTSNEIKRAVWTLIIQMYSGIPPSLMVLLFQTSFCKR